MASNSAEKKQHSPLGISISASLPIMSFPSSYNRQRSRLQTPSTDSNSQFGPPVEILPHLILGCAKDSSNLTLLRKLGVTSVLNVSHNCPNHFEGVLEYKSISVQDSYQADLLSKMEAAIEYISKLRERERDYGYSFIWQLAIATKQSIYFPKIHDVVSLSQIQSKPRMVVYLFTVMLGYPAVLPSASPTS